MPDTPADDTPTARPRRTPRPVDVARANRRPRPLTPAQRAQLEDAMAAQRARQAAWTTARGTTGPAHPRG